MMRRIVRQLLLEVGIPTTYCKEANLAADEYRAEIIQNFYDQVDNNATYAMSDPDTDMLLDPENGYEDQVYVQNLGNGRFKFWEGFSHYCWKAIYKRPMYKGMTKEDVIDHIGSHRFPNIAKMAEALLIDFGYFFEESYDEDIEDGYIMWAEMQINLDSDVEKNTERGQIQ